MEDHTRPLSRELCDSIRPGLFEEFSELGITQVLDISAFVKARGYFPASGSVFLVGDKPGGSYDCALTKGRYAGYTLFVHNGTLTRIESPRGEPRSVTRLSGLYEKLMYDGAEVHHSGQLQFDLEGIPG